MNDTIEQIDLWNTAALAALRGKPCPASDKHSLAGYQHGLDARAGLSADQKG